MLPLGTPAPDFTLPDAISGKSLSLNDIRGELATLVMFICNHCPYVKHVQEELVRLAQDYMDKGIGFVAINSNDVGRYPEDSPAQMRAEAQRLNYPFSYLYDETQDIARAYHAACTPDFFVFDQNLHCIYRGQLDSSRPGGENQSDGRDMRRVFDSILAGRPVPSDQQPSVGCNIKWK